MVCYSKLLDDIFARLLLSAACYSQESHAVTPWLVVVFLFPSCRSESLSYPIQILPEREFKIHFSQVQEYRGFKPVSVCEYIIKTLPYCCLLTRILKGLCMQHVSIHLRSKKPTENFYWYHSNTSSVCCSHPSLYRGMSVLCIESPQLL